MQLVTMLLLATRADFRRPARAINGLARRLGPGLITGAADDDPSGIATYSQAGAQFRFGLVWTVLLTTPLMIGIQMLSARIGWVTGEGLAANIAKFCPRWLTVGLVGLLVVANTINIAADIGAMGEAVRDAQDYTWHALAAGFRPGKGHHLPDRFFWARAAHEHAHGAA